MPRISLFRSNPNWDLHELFMESFIGHTKALASDKDQEVAAKKRAIWQAEWKRRLAKRARNAVP